ncbi:MAG: hypothetical protein ACM3MK_01155 [Chitinophagales bacterium]
MKKKRAIFPRSLFKSLSEDVKSLMDSNEGMLLALEILDDIPFEMRPRIIEGLSGFYLDEMAQFFHLVKEEYGKELEAVCNRALEKYQLAGINSIKRTLQPGQFFKAYTSRTRNSGQVTLDVAWHQEGGMVDVECFFLSFCQDGIHGFFVMSEVPAREYVNDRLAISDMLEIDLDEACFLLQEAYNCNIRNMTRPALGKFLYKKYLDYPLLPGTNHAFELAAKMSPDLTQGELVNSFFWAMRHHDQSYASALIDPGADLGFDRPPISDFFSPNLPIIEACVDRFTTLRNRSEVYAHLVQLQGEDLFRSELTFSLIKKGKRWLILNVTREFFQQIAKGEPSPFEDKVECAVYEILDQDALFGALEELDDIREVGELPFGVHLRIPQQDSVTEGVYFLSGVLADIVVNGDELVVIARDSKSITDINEPLTRNSGQVQLVQNYQVEVFAAYAYLSGQYLRFEDVLNGENEELFFEDGLRFVTARYSIRDMDRVTEKLGHLKKNSYSFPGECQVFYEFTGGRHKILMAEYVLGNNWITVSAFGDKEFQLVRRRFENGLKDCLEFEGIELKCEGLFELINSEVIKKYPYLENELKQAYLDKWYYSNLKPLQGMTPRDAAQSVEGKLLLWQMFKEMKRKERIRQNLGVANYIELKEYMIKVNMQKSQPL